MPDRCEMYWSTEMSIAEEMSAKMSAKTSTYGFTRVSTEASAEMSPASIYFPLVQNGHILDSLYSYTKPETVGKRIPSAGRNFDFESMHDAKWASFRPAVIFNQQAKLSAVQFGCGQKTSVEKIGFLIGEASLYAMSCKMKSNASVPACWLECSVYITTFE